MPHIRFSVADIEVRLAGPDLGELLAAVQLLLPLLEQVDRDAPADEADEPRQIGFGLTTDLDPDRQRRTEPVWFDDEE